MGGVGGGAQPVRRTDGGYPIGRTVSPKAMGRPNAAKRTRPCSWLVAVLRPQRVFCVFVYRGVKPSPVHFTSGGGGRQGLPPPLRGLGTVCFWAVGLWMAKRGWGVFKAQAAAGLIPCWS